MINTFNTEQNSPINPALDDKDWAILKILQANAKATVKEIAEKVHLSTTPVHERIRKLEQSGIIKQYTVMLDHTKVKRGLMVICYVSLKQHGTDDGKQFIDKVLQMDEVVECYSISGEYDFMLKVLTENMETYYKFHVHKLSQSGNIAHLQSVFVMGIVKQVFV